MTVAADSRCPYPWCSSEPVTGGHRSLNYGHVLPVQLVAAGDVMTIEVAGHPITLDEAESLRHAVRVALATAGGGWPLLRLRLGIVVSDAWGTLVWRLSTKAQRVGWALVRRAERRR